MQMRYRLKKISYGDWEVQKQYTFRLHYEEDSIRWQTDPARNLPTGGENVIQIAARALPIIIEIESKYKTRNVLLLSHKATIRNILCSLLGIDVALTAIVSPRCFCVD